MAKRSSGQFERVARDLYPTPLEPVLALRGHIPYGIRYCEPCAGDGRLVSHLAAVISAVCMHASDLVPQADWILRRDARRLTRRSLGGAEIIVTNPPWERKILHELIRKFLTLAPAWLLLDADWIHTKQAVPFKPSLARVVSVGRVRWIEGSGATGKDNAAWHLFDAANEVTTRFYGFGEAFFVQPKRNAIGTAGEWPA